MNDKNRVIIACPNQMGVVMIFFHVRLSIDPAKVPLKSSILKVSLLI